MPAQQPSVNRDSMVPAGIFPKLPRFPTSIPAVFPLIEGFSWDFLENLGRFQSKHCQDVFSWEHRIEPKRHHVISFGNACTSGQDGHCPPHRIFTDQQPAGQPVHGVARQPQLEPFQNSIFWQSLQQIKVIPLTCYSVCLNLKFILKETYRSGALLRKHFKCL